MFKKLIKFFTKDIVNPLPTATRSSRGVSYTKINLPRSNLKQYSPRYDYARFKEKYRSLYSVDPMLVEQLFQEYKMTFCSGKDHYTMIRNFIIGYQLLYGMHRVDEEYSFDHRVCPTLGQIDELKINFPGYRFRHQKGYEGDDFWCFIYQGNDVPDERILSAHHKLGSK